MTQTFDVAVIGAGIVGLAHAWMAARQGLNVVLFDRSSQAIGATVRNFGMVWPIGQPAGELYETALRSRELWLELHTAGVIHADTCGALHLAHHDDELAVLEEFASGRTHDCTVLSIADTMDRAPIANPDGLRGSLWSPTELRVNPRTAAAGIAAWLESRHGVQRQFNTPIVNVDADTITSADGRQWRAERVIICSGSDLQTLFPDVLAQSGLKLCKLQMLRSVAQPATVRQHAHIASGLTLRHYTSFQHCPSLVRVKERFADQNPDLDRYGIHVMATQSANGEFILGDSHEYGDDMTPFDKAVIDTLILQELQKIIRLPDWTIKERWHGVYAKHSQRPIFEAQPQPNVFVSVGPGGAGMTMSFGLAERAWNKGMAVMQ
ncbi:MAG: TIGR03364 family FAD-dependent oxidoreductase [Planctomycetaceae bacterium]